MINHKTLAAAKIKYKNPGKETVDMCKAIDDMVKDGKAEGIKIGEARGKRIGEKAGKKLGESIRIRQKLYREYGLNG